MIQKQILSFQPVYYQTNIKQINDSKFQNEQLKTLKEAEDNKDMIRISKRLSELGLCSRREADEYIKQGLVLVDGVIVDQLGAKIQKNQKIELKIQALCKQQQKATFVLNKPYTYVSNLPEHGNKSAVQLLIKENQFLSNSQDLNQIQFSSKHLSGVAPAGRLDLHSQGLMLYTQDGRVAKKIIGEDSTIEKEYIVRVGQKVTKQQLEILRNGSIKINGKNVLPARVEVLNEHQLRFVLKEGKKRQIRIMCDYVNLKVSGLKRVRIGPIILGKLPEGMWRFITNKELQELMK